MELIARTLVSYCLNTGGSILNMTAYDQIFMKPSPTASQCPSCGEPVSRIHRRLVDRLVSLFRSKRRYRCENPACRWEGNLPIRRR